MRGSMVTKEKPKAKTPHHGKKTKNENKNKICQGVKRKQQNKIYLFFAIKTNSSMQCDSHGRSNECKTYVKRIKLIISYFCSVKFIHEI